MNRPSSETFASSVDCPPASRLDAYFDRELPDAERAAIESHLATCAACRDALEKVAAASSIMQSIELPALSQMSRARLTRDLASQEVRVDRWVLPIRLLTAAAAAIFLLATSLIAYQMHHASGSTQPRNVQPIGTQFIQPGGAHILPTVATNPAQP
jgi:anti-sigma factor RsiW